ncbi:hypothetical protein F4703DRAFT_1594667 [Phycomyces blakesleeanus]
MLASDLPFEILSKIARLLVADDKLSCILTCKAWKIPFQESLWENIKINFMDKLETICTSVKDTTNNYLPSNHITKGLRVDGKTILADWKQTSAFKTFPNLKHVDMGSLSFYNVNIKRIKYGPQWDTLNSLYFKVPPIDRKISTTAILEVLKKASNLKEICIYSDHHYVEIEFNLNQYNAFHIALPRMVNIRVQLMLKDIHPDAVPSIPKTLSALDVTKLYLKLSGWSHLWLYYFCYKYLNLQTLSFVSICRLGGIVIKKTTKEKYHFSVQLREYFHAWKQCVSTVWNGQNGRMYCSGNSFAHRTYVSRI